VMWVSNYKLLPETLHVDHRQPFNVRHLMRGYWQLGSDPRFLALALASGVPFNGMFLYVLSAPVFLGEHLHLTPGQFFWFFCLTIGGIMAGARLSGRRAGVMKPRHQIRAGFLVMFGVAVLNLLLNIAFTPSVWWAMFPVAIFSFGWAIMASSLQAFVGSMANGLVAGAIAPLVMHSTVALAATSLGMLCIGLFAWLWVKRKVT